MGSGGPRGLQNRSGLTTSGWVGSIPTRSRQRALGVLLAIATVALGGSAAEAQVVRGVVLAADSIAVAPSVIVTASDPRGPLLGRAVTDARGEFTMTLDAPGRVIIRALRVGFRPTETAVRELGAADTVLVRIVLAPEPVRLSAITVRRSDPCGARDDARARVAVVWEEARKALVLTNTARTRDALVAEWTVYDRQLDSLGVRVIDQSVQRTRAPSERPFRSWAADSLARAGFIVEDEAGVSYHAPDADVLLSDAFAATHCFQLVDGEPGSGRIGVRFRPIDEARTRREVEGTLWLDRETAELRHLEYAYTGLPQAAAPAEPGGRVEFQRIADGAWLVTRWWIRMPELERRIPSRVTGGRIRVVGPSIALKAVKVVGGEVTRVERGGVAVYRATGASLAVRVTLPDGEDPARSSKARVMLAGTDYEAVVDSAGIARFPLVLPGRYRVAVNSPALMVDHDPPVLAEVAVHGDSLHWLPVQLPRRRMTAAALGLVPRTSVRAEVEFTVTDSLGRPIAGVEIGAVDAAAREYRLRSDSLGRAVLTGLPLGEMRVEARSPGYYLAYGMVTVAEGLTPATVLLERMQGGTVLEAVRIEAAADERARYGAFEARRRAGGATATLTSEQILRRNPVNAWQMLLNVSAVDLVEGPEGAQPASRRAKTPGWMNVQPCWMRMAIDGVLLPDVPVNLRDRMPPVSEIHGIEVFAGPASIPSEYVGDQRNMFCGLIVVWTR